MLTSPTPITGPADLFGGLGRNAEASQFTDPRQAARRSSLLTRAFDRLSAERDRVRLDRTNHEAGLGNALRNLDLAAEANLALSDAGGALDTLAAAVAEAQSTGATAGLQAAVDAALDAIKAAGGSTVAGRSLFGATGGPATVVEEARAVTDNAGHLDFDAAPLKVFDGRGGTAAVDGTTLTLTGDASRGMKLAAPMSSLGTFIEFDLKVDPTATTQGIALTSGDGATAQQLATVAELEDLGDAGDGFRRYRVSAEELVGFDATFDRIAFVNEGPGSTAEFRDVQVRFQPEATVGGGGGLTREIYSGQIGSGSETLIATDTDDNVHHFWGYGGPAGQTDNFSLRLTGKVQAKQTGTYRLRITGDDGFRADVNGVREIDEWRHQPHIAAASAEFDVRRGDTLDLTIEYFEGMFGARLEVDLVDPDGNRVDLENQGLFYGVGESPTQAPEVALRPDAAVETFEVQTTPRRAFNSGPRHVAGASSSRLDPLDPLDLGTTDNLLAELRGGHRLELAGGDFAAIGQAVDAARAQVRLMQVANDAFARSMAADVNVFGLTQPLIAASEARLDEVGEGRQALAEARRLMLGEALDVRRSVALGNPMIGLDLLR